MLRFLTPVLLAFVTIVFGLDAVAQPCDLRMTLQVEASQEAMMEMPCHEGIMAGTETNQPNTPDPHEETCCCAALLTNAVTVDHMSLAHPLPGLTLWAMPLPDKAFSLSIEDEPPPPRA